LSDELQRLSIGHHRVPCPECARAKQRRRDTALAVDVGHDGGVWLCHRCGWTGGWRAERSYARAGAVRAPKPRSAQQHLTLASHFRDFWRSLALIVPGTTAHAYLTARKVAIPPSDGDLRCAELLPHPSGYIGPALVALVSDALTREPLTLHKTWIKPDGTKADLDKPRLLLGQHRKRGGVIRLWPDESVTTGITVAEGVETSLAVATVRQPVWSTIDADNLAALPVLAGIEELLIFADNDLNQRGQRAARECATRWYAAGVRVRIAMPPKPDTDACDVLKEDAA
jgi:putative DNA primase/helicase